jgi:hypothetical protein
MLGVDGERALVVIVARACFSVVRLVVLVAIAAFIGFAGSVITQEAAPSILLQSLAFGVLCVT